LHDGERVAFRFLLVRGGCNRDAAVLGFDGFDGECCDKGVAVGLVCRIGAIEQQAVGQGAKGCKQLQRVCLLECKNIRFHLPQALLWIVIFYTVPCLNLQTFYPKNSRMAAVTSASPVLITLASGGKAVWRRLGSIGSSMTNTPLSVLRRMRRPKACLSLRRVNISS
jgi:hypothetical protein